MDIDDLPLEDYDDLITKFSKRRKNEMAKMKYTNVGYFAKKKKDPNARQVVITKSIKVEVGEDGKPIPLYIQMYDIKQSEKQTDEQFEQLKSWKLKDLVIVSEE